MRFLWWELQGTFPILFCSWFWSTPSLAWPGRTCRFTRGLATSGPVFVSQFPDGPILASIPRQIQTVFARLATLFQVTLKTAGGMHKYGDTLPHPKKIRFLLGDFKWKTSSFFLFIDNQGFSKSKNLTIIRQKKKRWDSGRPFYRSGTRRDCTSNVVGRSGLSSSEYGGDRRNTKASTGSLQPVREEGRWPAPRDFLTLIDRLRR
jgi:hypothetical protein